MRLKFFNIEELRGCIVLKILIVFVQYKLASLEREIKI